MKLVVTPHRPLRKALLSAAALLIVLLAIAVALDYGHWRAIAGAMVSTGEKRSLLEEVISLRRENEDLNYRLARAERNAEINSAMKGEHHARMVELRTELAELQGEIEFFRDVIGGTEIGTGPRVGGLRLSRLDTSGRYRYALVMTHVGKENQVAEGELRIDVQGLSGDEAQSLGFAQIMESGPERLAFKFKHFHLFEGTLKIPDDFTPHRIEVAVQSGRKRSTARSEIFDWMTVLAAPGNES